MAELNRTSSLYPIALNNMSEKLAVVVGGGPVGARKAQGVLNAGGQVLLISPEAVPVLETWANEGQILWKKRPFLPTDLQNASLVFAATNSRDVNHAIAIEAKRRKILCNVADNPAEGDFHSPAVLRHDGLVIGINNEARNPRRAIEIREQIREWLEDGE